MHVMGTAQNFRSWLELLYSSYHHFNQQILTFIIYTVVSDWFDIGGLMRIVGFGSELPARRSRNNLKMISLRRGNRSLHSALRQLHTSVFITARVKKKKLFYHCQTSFKVLGRFCGYQDINMQKIDQQFFCQVLPSEESCHRTYSSIWNM